MDKPKKKLVQRKPYTASKKNLTILLRQPETRERLQALAEADKRSLNSLVNKILEEYLEKN